jgi:polyhydroxyalkanoate synthesis regulator phasin
VSEDDGWRRYVEAANALRQMAQARAEEVVRDLLASGETETDHVRQWSDDLLERSRIVVDELVDVVRIEVTRQLESLGLNSPEDLLRRLTETFTRSTRSGGEPAPVPDPPIDVRSLPLPASTSASVTQKAPSKRASSQKSAAKKGATAKKAPAKAVAPGKQAPAKKAAKGSTGTTARQNALSTNKTAKKAANKTAKKTASKKSSGRGS